MLFQQNKFGPLRTFSSEDLVNTLFFLEKGPTPRKKLSELLELGEGATRTIITILTTQRLIQTKKKGCILTPSGKRELKKTREKIAAITTVPPSDLTYNQEATCIVLKNASKNIKNGLDERDAAIKAGANGATILVSGKDALFFPDSHTQAKTLGLPKTQDGDVLILAYGRKQRRSAISVAMHIIQKG